ncbi:MAG: hypothetical protein ACLFVD_02720 [Dehalococcoidia bacterium]
MPEEQEQDNEQQDQEPQENPGAPAETDGVSTEEDLESIRAQLEEERTAAAEALAALTEKDEHIALLQTELSEARQLSEAAQAERTTLQEAHGAAVQKYLEAVKAANPSLPPETIAGSTIEDIDASVEKAQAIAQAVKASLENEARNTRVPAGAPTRAIDLESLSPAEKIKLGLSQSQGGTS